MKTLLVLIAALALCALPAAAQWVEDGDAGDLPATAQVPLGEGPLLTIQGDCPANDVDMYCIQLTDPATFVAHLCGGATWDTQLFLFTAEGVGVTWDDDTCDPGLQSSIGSFAVCPYAAGPGTYYIALSKYNRDPRDGANAAIFAAAGCNLTNGAPIASWTGTTTVGGAYTLTLENVNYCGTVAVEPSTWGAVKSLYH